MLSSSSERLQVWLPGCMQCYGNSADSPGHPQDPYVRPNYRHAPHWTGKMPNTRTDKLRKTAADFQCYSFLDTSLVIQQNEKVFCHNILKLEIIYFCLMWLGEDSRRPSVCLLPDIQPLRGKVYADRVWWAGVLHGGGGQHAGGRRAHT